MDIAVILKQRSDEPIVNYDQNLWMKTCIKAANLGWTFESFTRLADAARRCPQIRKRGRSCICERARISACGGRRAGMWAARGAGAGGPPPGVGSGGTPPPRVKEKRRASARSGGRGPGGGGAKGGSPLGRGRSRGGGGGGRWSRKRTSPRLNPRHMS